MTWPPVLIPDSDHENVDRFRDDLAVPDPYELDSRDITAEPLAVMPPGTTTTVPAVMAGRAGSVRAPLPTPLRGGALTDHPVDL